MNKPGIPLPTGERLGEGVVPEGPAAGIHGAVRSPSPQPSPPRGEGAAGDPVYRSGAKAKPTLSETARARRLRRLATDAETLLWSRLRGRQLGAKFRRQEPVLGYTADFVAHRHRLIVEVDGGQHASQMDRDERRTRALELAGYRVLRFWNNDVLQNLDGVMETILQALNAPLPSGERLGEGAGR